MGFGISSGSLIYTALFKLLPKAGLYFEGGDEHGDGIDGVGTSGGTGALTQQQQQPASLKVMVFFNCGVLLCLALNFVIHYFASESIVHCSHGGDEEEGHHHHHHGHRHGEGEGGHEHNHSSSSESLELMHKHSHTTTEEAPSTNATATNPTNTNTATADERSPLLPHQSEAVPPLQKRASLFALWDKFKDPNKCVCLSEENCEGHPCISQQFTDKISNDIQNLEFYRELRNNSKKKSLVAYTTTTTGGTTGGASMMGTTMMAAPGTTPLAITTTTMSHENNDELLSEPLRLSNEPDLELHHLHKDDHHHQINTPVSRILSLGLQTCLALTLHKLPEGFITYATSKADARAGIAIFLSLAIHNVVEGFSMVLPLYLAFNSRAKAFGITFVLGGFSQPLGALMAYLLLHGREIDTDETDYVFGVLVAITCGFLTIISLQLFASAINFGGSTGRVVGWCLAGIFVIQLSGVLTDYSFA